MKRNGFDWLLVILAALVLLAMAATLLSGTGRSRHGYGTHRSSTDSPTTTYRSFQGSPCNIG